MIIKLPFPDAALNPNRKNGKHWGATNALKELTKNTAYYLTKERWSGKLMFTEPMPLKITFVQSDKRKRDLDNLLSASKASLDGIALALGIDDRLFEPIILMRGYDKAQNYMTVEFDF